MSTPFILASLSAVGAVWWLVQVLAPLERTKHLTAALASDVAPVRLALSDFLRQQPNQDAASDSTTGQSGVRRPSPVTQRMLRNRDPIRRYREVTGRRAKVRWWQRLQALILLTVIIVALGLILAVLVGIAFLAGTILLETVA